MITSLKYCGCKKSSSSRWLPFFFLCVQALCQEGQATTKQYSLFGVDLRKLRNYQIVYPIEIKPTYNNNNNNTHDRFKHFKIEAYGDSYDIIFVNKMHNIEVNMATNNKNNNNNNNNTGSNTTTDTTRRDNKIYVEYIDRNNSYQAKYFKSDECFYNGPSLASTGSVDASDSKGSLHLVLDYCNGLEGMIQSDNTTLFIEPIKTEDENAARLNSIHRKHLVYRSTDVIHDAPVFDKREKAPAIDFRLLTVPLRRRQRRSGYQSFLYVTNRSNRKVQIYYYNSKSRLIPFILLLPNEGRGINTFESTKWVAKDDKTSQMFFLNGRDEFVTSANSQDKRTELVVTIPPGTTFVDDVETNEVGGTDYYIQVLVVADKSMVDYHGKGHVEKYLNTMMRIVSDIFQHKSLGSRVHFNVAKIVLLESEEIGFTVYKDNPSRTLRSACEYTTSLNHRDQGHSDHFDVAIAMTRKKFGPSGYAQMYSMCSSRRSCAIVNDEGLTSSFIVAHEVAHLLGVDHDGEGDSSRCQDDQARGSVMAPVIVSSYSRYHWSSCSKEILKVNIEYFSCLSNSPRKPEEEQLSNKLPGSSYTVDEQCRMSHYGSSKCKTFNFDPCHRLWCSSTQRKCISRGPALSGTVCARNKFCFKGECVEEENNNKKEPPPTIVHGQWSRWTSWSDCSQTCGVGLRFRGRKCDNPKPGPGGEVCPGNHKEMDICSTQACRITKSYTTQLVEQCTNIKDDQWTLYLDRDFEKKLRQRQNNLNCTFEEGFCNWQQEAVRSDLKWHLHSGSTNSRETGPSADQTTRTKKGKYIYMEASSTFQVRKSEGDVARLISRVVQVPRVCFAFHYHMYGRDMGALRLNIRFKNGTEVNRWNMTGNQGDRWHHAQVSIENAEDFQFIMEAVRGGHWSGDIAVDDITIMAGRCPEVRVENPCKVSCRTKSASSFLLNIDVRDGINCNPNRRSNDICLNGVCVPFGCDNKFGSTLKLDDCGICGGNGSSCTRMAGTKEKYLKENYEVFITLKKGTTFINFTEKSETSLYYGIRKLSNNGIYLSTLIENYFTIDDATFHFFKVNGRQRIVAKGPTREDLDVLVYSFQKSRTKPAVLDYEFFQPKGYTYEYRITSWEACSRSCGTGKQKSIVNCVRMEDDTKVEHSFCKSITNKPTSIKSCNLKDCPEKFIWIPRRWGECDQTCGGGRQTRHVDCVRAYDNALVASKYCRADSKPETSQICNTNKCYRWQAHEWGKCSTTCGQGVRIRLTTCMDGELLAEDKMCVEKLRPLDHEACNLQECDLFQWKIMMETPCSASCGGGKKAVIVNCVRKKQPNMPVDNELCTGPAPERLKDCNTHHCPEYVWKFGEESPCSASCGPGTKERSVTCVDQATEIEAKDERHCKQRKPDIVVPCDERQCAGYKVAFSAWQDCDVMCGTGVQKRNPYCITEDYKKVVDPSLCGDRLKTKEERVCQKSSCAVPADLKCSFSNKNTCNWTNGRTDDFEWALGKTTPSLNTGPNRDHTTRNGYFAYIEASRPRKYGDRATLVSPIVRAKRGCLVFWYHMRGSAVDHLRLYFSTALASHVMFEKNGEKGRDWLLAEIDVNPSWGTSSGYKFIFEAKVGRAAYGDIALDDINFHDKSCKDLNLFHNPIMEECRQISRLCKKDGRVRRYCTESPQFRLLCCRTCAELMNPHTPTSHS